MMKLPAKYASKFGHYDVTVHSTSVKVRVVDNLDVVSLGLSELKSAIGKNMIVGNVACCGNVSSTIPMMVLCVNSRCLIIQVCRLEHIIPQCLIDFLKDKENCFVGPDMKTTLSRLSEYSEYKNGYLVNCFSCLSGMDVGDLAAKSLLDPTLLSNKRTTSREIAECMQDIADKVGVTLEKNTSDNASIDMAALAFSRDQITGLVSDVYASYLIVAKLFESHKCSDS